RDAKIIGLVSGAHFVSHVYMLVLPPLFAFVRADYAVNYAELGMAIAAFNVVSLVFQPPAGFLTDRFGARRLLMGGLVLSGVGVIIAGSIPSYAALVGGMALMGLANTIYHPADYSILSHSIPGRRIGQAFSIHTFFGTLGTAIAPVTMLFFAKLWGWHGAFVGASVFGFGMALVLLLNRDALPEPVAAPRVTPTSPAVSDKTGWHLLFSPPIIRNVAFFVILSMATGGISGFSIVALGALYGTPVATANFVLSAYLLCNAIGVLAGGYVATRAHRHEFVAVVGFIGSGALILLVGLVDLGAGVLAMVMALSGFLNGVIQPSRDMIVRAATPHGSFGKVFGFVSTGFNFAGIAAPLLFGWLMDQAHPRSVFIVVAALTLLSLPLLTGKPARASGATAAAD
ncbi:MAG: MFS transporter, partial [Alphaproteobacteria bacterium]|nr:MFS transporter [Alphaproteobacteria bacterium]